MGERDDARHEIEDARERLSLIAEELSRRASPAYIRDRAKEATVSKVNAIKTRTTTSPLALAVLGGAIGAGLGALVARNQREKHLERRLYGEWDDTRATGRSLQRWQGADVDYRGYERWSEPAFRGSPEGSISDRGYGSELDQRSGRPGSDVSGLGSASSASGGYGAEAGYRGVERGGAGWATGSEVGPSVSSGIGSQGALGAVGTEGITPSEGHGPSRKEQIKERGREVKERLSHKADELKSRASNRFDTIKHRASDMRERLPSSDEVRMRARERWDRQPVVMSLIALILGSVIGMMLPVSRKEREALEPARRRLREGVQGLGDNLDQRLQGEPSSKGSAQGGGQGASGSGSFGGQGASGSGSFGGQGASGSGSFGSSGGGLPATSGGLGTSGSRPTGLDREIGGSHPSGGALGGGASSGGGARLGSGGGALPRSKNSDESEGAPRASRSEDPSRGRAGDSKPGLGGGQSLSGEGGKGDKGRDIGKPTWPSDEYKS